MLVEFPRVVDTVRCAVETQRLMVDRNAEVSEDKRITLRTGVNLGASMATISTVTGQHRRAT